jgi:hypothetical protein
MHHLDTDAPGLMRIEQLTQTRGTRSDSTSVRSHMSSWPERTRRTRPRNNHNHEGNCRVSVKTVGRSRTFVTVKMRSLTWTSFTRQESSRKRRG